MSYFEVDAISASYINNVLTQLSLYGEIRDFSKIESKYMELGSSIHKMLEDRDNGTIWNELLEVPLPKMTPHQTKILKLIESGYTLNAAYLEVKNNAETRKLSIEDEITTELAKKEIPDLLQLDYNLHIAQKKELLRLGFYDIVSYNKSVKAISLYPFQYENYKESYSELEIYWEYNGVNCKSKIDKIYVFDDCILVIDYKTHSQDFIKNYKNHKYFNQFAFYAKAVEYQFKDYNLPIIFETHAYHTEYEVWKNYRINNKELELAFSQSFIHPFSSYRDSTISCLRTNDEVEPLFSLLTKNDLRVNMGIDYAINYLRQ